MNGQTFETRYSSTTLSKCRVKHKVDTPYYPLTSGQVKVSNSEIKMTLVKSVKTNLSDWSQKINDELWAYLMNFKTLIGRYPYKLVFGKACHLLIDHEHKSFRALKKLNLSWSEAADLRLEQLNEMDEFWILAYERVSLYKERMKLYYDKRIEEIEF